MCCCVFVLTFQKQSLLSAVARFHFEICLLKLQCCSSLFLWLQVTPVIGRLVTTQALTPNPSEVNAVFDMPLAAFLEDVPSHTYKDAEWQGIKYRLHYFEYNDFLVWGLTAAMLIQVAQHAFARPTDFLELTPGSRPYHQLFFNGERLLWQDSPSS